MGFLHITLLPAVSRPAASSRRSLCSMTTVTPGRELVRPPAARLAASGPLTSSEIDEFFSTGYVIARGIVPGALLADLQSGSAAVEARSVSLPVYEKLGFNTWDAHPAYREVVVSSPISRAAAQLTPTSAAPRGLVAVKDAYFRLRGDNQGCHFHVDDPFFWPCPRDAPGPGVNVWIALDDVGTSGGGLTVAPGSHTEPFVNIREIIKGNTCLLHELDPVQNDRLESIAVSPLFSAGDAIFCTRFLFHRGNPFDEDAGDVRDTGIRRYSVRYMPGDAVVEEVKYEDGKLVYAEPVVLRHADPDRFPAVKL